MSNDRQITHAGIMNWIRMSDRKPTVDDADESGTVWVYDKVFADVSSVHFYQTDSPYYTHWMPKGKRPAPPAPNRRLAVNGLTERLRAVKWEVADDCSRMPDDPTHKCVFVDMRPDDFRALLREAAAALEAAQMGLRYAVRVWVLSDEIKWSDAEIDEVVESIIGDAKKEKGK